MKDLVLSATLFFCLLNASVSAQTDSLWQQKPTLVLHGFADVYYVYDFNKPQTTDRQSFLFNHNRHNEFNLNLGFIKFEISHAKYRSNIALQAGTYSNDNYAAEPGLLKNVFEANIGISLNKKNNLWLDAGVLPSHIGFESAVSIDNFTLTRSMLAENSPYFLTGAKLTFMPIEKCELSMLIVNGWQRIQRLQGNSLPSFGTQVNYSFRENILFNWSSFIGTDDPDTTRRMRYFNNFYTQFQATKKLALITGFDIGVQQQMKASNNYNVWYSPVVIVQYQFSNKIKSAFRAEYYDDQEGVIINVNNVNGFKTTGLSLNVDYSPIPILACRIEGRWLYSKGNVFKTETFATNNNFIIAASLAINFSKTIN